jgi:anion-transporting  ArsA/GET3 family ATPase
LSRRIHLIAGKGGVGRSTVASALAEAAAGHGKRVLLTEIGHPDGGDSAIGRAFGVACLTPDPEPLGPPGLSGCHIWATRGHERFAHSVVPAGPLIRAALSSKALRRFVAAVPSLYELGLFYHLLTLLRATNDHGEPEHEIIVADMPATGHTLGLTRLPAILLDALPDGPIPRAMREGQSYLNDPAKCLAWVVTLPELLPVTEALELIDGLRGTDVTPAGVILNRVPDDPFEPDEREALGAVLAEHPMHGELGFRRIGEAIAMRSHLADACDLAVLELPECSEASASSLQASLAAKLGSWMAPS